MIDENIKKYRKIHKKCKWCKYYEYYLYPHWLTWWYGKCLLKDKIINCKNLSRLCKYYELKETNNEIPTNKSN